MKERDVIITTITLCISPLSCPPFPNSKEKVDENRGRGYVFVRRQVLRRGGIIIHKKRGKEEGIRDENGFKDQKEERENLN